MLIGGLVVCPYLCGPLGLSIMVMRWLPLLLLSYLKDSMEEGKGKWLECLSLQENKSFLRALQQTLAYLYRVKQCHISL